MTPKFLAQVRVTGEEHARLAALVALLDTSVSAVLREQLDKVLPGLLKNAEEVARKRNAMARTPAGKVNENAIDTAAEQLAIALNRSEPITLRIDELLTPKAGAVLRLLLYLWQTDPDESTARKLAAFEEKYYPRLMRSPVPAEPLSTELPAARIKTNPRRRSGRE